MTLKKLTTVIALLTLIYGCSILNPPTSHKYSFLSLGTFININIVTSDKTKAQLAAKELRQLFDKLNNLMSLYMPESQINRLNQDAAKDWVEVDPMLFEIIEKSIAYSQMTDGAFDITVCPLVELWGFGKDKTRKKPSDSSIAAKLKDVGYQNISLDKENCRIKFNKKGVQIDLGGIAKGFALEKSIPIFKKHGIKNALIDAGGNIYCLGKNGSKKWLVGIRDPKDAQKLIKQLALQNQAIATSGGYENFFDENGRRHQHIIDPKTGYPVDNSILSVSIISDDPTLTDALSTALFVMGAEKAKTLVKNIKNTRIFIVLEKENLLEM